MNANDYKEFAYTLVGVTKGVLSIDGQLHPVCFKLNNKNNTFEAVSLDTTDKMHSMESAALVEQAASKSDAIVIILESYLLPSDKAMGNFTSLKNHPDRVEAIQVILCAPGIESCFNVLFTGTKETKFNFVEQGWDDTYRLSEQGLQPFRNPYEKK